MPRTVCLTIPWFRPPTWNHFYAGGHWGYRNRVASEIHTIVCTAWVEAGEPPMFEHPVIIRTTVYFPHHPQDATNIAAKLFEDGLIGRLIKDDAPDYVSEVRVASRIDKDNPRIEICIEEIEDSNDPKK